MWIFDQRFDVTWKNFCSGGGHLYILPNGASHVNQHLINWCNLFLFFRVEFENFFKRTLKRSSNFLNIRSFSKITLDKIQRIL